jgi:hypothetical protein
MATRSFDRFGALCAAAAAVAGFGYSVAFVIYLHNGARGAAYADALLLMVGGIASTAVFSALFQRLRDTDPALALFGLALALAAAFGAAIHGAYDLANLANPPASAPSDLPDAVDPRGFATFALAGLAVAVTGVLIVRGRQLPIALGYLAFVSAALLVFVYIGRLVILNPKNPALLTAAVIVGFVVNPAWYAWVARTLWRNCAGPSAQRAVYPTQKIGHMSAWP